MEAEEDHTGWNYERTTSRSFPEIIISEGAIDEPVAALVCRHCGYHRVKLVGWGRELAFCQQLPSVLGIGGGKGPLCGDTVEVLIFRCPRCNREMKIGAEDAQGLFSRVDGAVQKDLNDLEDAIGKLFPDVFKDINRGKRVVDETIKLIRKYYSLLTVINGNVDREELNNARGRSEKEG